MLDTISTAKIEWRVSLEFGSGEKVFGLFPVLTDTRSEKKSHLLFVGQCAKCDGKAEAIYIYVYRLCSLFFNGSIPSSINPTINVVITLP